jgi:hypothetical protein
MILLPAGLTIKLFYDYFASPVIRWFPNNLLPILYFNKKFQLYVSFFDYRLLPDAIMKQTYLRGHVALIRRRTANRLERIAALNPNGAARLLTPCIDEISEVYSRSQAKFRHWRVTAVSQLRTVADRLLTGRFGSGPDYLQTACRWSTATGSSRPGATGHKSRCE